MAESRVSRMEGVRFSRMLMARYLPRWVWIAGGATLAAAIAGGFFDLRVALAGWMLILVVMPALLAIAYYSYGLREECVINRIPHSLKLSNGDLAVRMRIKEFSEDEPSGEQEDKSGGEEHYRIREFVIGPADVESWETTLKGGILGIRKRFRGFLEIRGEDFESSGDFVKIAEWSKANADKNNKRGRQ